MIVFQAGSFAGISVDIFLYPIDTIKTRLQSGYYDFERNVGKHRFFAGLPAVALGSAPGGNCLYL